MGAQLGSSVAFGSWLGLWGSASEDGAQSASLFIMHFHYQQQVQP